MPALPETIQDAPIVRAIYENYAARHKSEKPRRYLGASVIGKACARALWYEFRWCGSEEFSGRMLRLFESGHREESRLIDNLRAAGCEVHEVDPATGQQFAISDLGGHFGGHMDGCILGIPDAPKTWHVLECKTHNAKSFKALREKGVLAHKPEHFAQMQVYMHLTGMERALYLAQNKDTDELYAERIKYDFGEASRILARARMIIEAEYPPERIGEADSFACKWCNHKERCHGPTAPTPAVPVRVTCRNCCHATPVVDGGAVGQWRCERHNKTLSEAEQIAGCEDHLLIPDLVTFATVHDSDGESIEYATFTTTWRNGKRPGEYRSIELTQMPAPLVGAGIIDSAKKNSAER